MQKNHFAKQIAWLVFFQKKGHASGNNIAKKIFWWNNFCNSYKDYYKRKCSNYFVIISARMLGNFWVEPWQHSPTKFEKEPGRFCDAMIGPFLHHGCADQALEGKNHLPMPFSWTDRKRRGSAELQSRATPETSAHRGSARFRNPGFDTPTLLTPPPFDVEDIWAQKFGLCSLVLPKPPRFKMTKFSRRGWL